MSALEWLNAVRADLDAATPGPWGVEVTDWEVSVFQHDQPDDPYAGFGRAYVCQNLTQGETEGEADARLIASAPDRLDKMERALRAVTERHRPIEVEPSDTICAACSNQLPNGRFLPAIEWPCPDVDVILEVLGDE